MSNTFENWLEIEKLTVDLRAKADKFDTEIVRNADPKAIKAAHLELVENLQLLESQCIAMKRKAINNVWTAYAEFDTARLYGG